MFVHFNKFYVSELFMNTKQKSANMLKLWLSTLNVAWTLGYFEQILDMSMDVSVNMDVSMDVGMDVSMDIKWMLD